MNKIDEIKELKKLLDEGAISDEEFQMLKKNILLEAGATINHEESNTNQTIEKKESEKKSTKASKSKITQSKSAKRKNTEGKTKSQPVAEESEWSTTFMALGAIAGFILIFVFIVRYESSVLFFIAILLMIAPIIISFVKKFRFSKPLVLFILFAFNIFLIAVPIGNTSKSSSKSSSSNADDRAVLHCIFCKKVIYGKPHEDIMCYTNEPDGCGIVFFNSGTKYAFCSEECCQYYRAID